MDAPRTQHAVAVLDKIIYVIGGCGDGANKVMRFDTKQQKWFDCAPLGVQRSTTAVAQMDGYIYVSGGTQNSDRKTNMVERYNPMENVWTKVCFSDANIINPRFSTFH